MSSAQVFVDFKAKGSDPFSANVKVHHKLIDFISPLVLDILDDIPVTKDQTFVIGDYGTADGGTSYDLIKKVIGVLRGKYGNEMPVQIVYEDQPVNDFSPIFNRIEELTAEFPNTFVLASGRSFFRQCVPPESASLLLCFDSAHWLSRCPDVKSTEMCPTITQTDANQAFRKQSVEDWEDFLFYRAKELKTGGTLIVTLLDTEGGDMRRLLTQLDSLWQGLHRDGIINQAELLETYITFYLRSRDEILEPFVNKESRVSGSGLGLVSIETQLVPSPHAKQWTQITNNIQVKSTDSDTIEHHAATIVSEVRAWQEQTLWNGLDSSRSDAEKKDIIDTYYSRYLDWIMEDPTIHHHSYLQYFVVMRKFISNKNDNCYQATNGEL